MLIRKQVVASLVLGIFLAGISSIGCGASNSPTTYDFKDKGYSISIPGNWKAENWNDKMTQAWIAPAKELIANVAVTPMEIGNDEPLKNNTPKLLAAILKNNVINMKESGKKVLSTGKAFIGGLESVYFTSSNKTTDGLEIFETFFVRSGNRIYPIVCSYYEEDGAKVKPVLAQILKSIKFEK